MTRRNRWTNLVPPQIRESVRAEVRADATAEIFICDVIDSWGGDWGVSAADVTAALAELGDVTALDVRLNSPGGDYFEGVAVAHALARHPATVTVRVDGLAASAASVIAMGGDRIVMGQGSQMMIHEASSMAWGTADEMRRTAAMLDQTNDDIAALYAQRTGGDQAVWREAVADETWYTAAQAVAAGLADEVAPLPARQQAEEALAARAPAAQPAAVAPEPPAPETDSAPEATAPPAPEPQPAAVNLSELVCSAIREAVTL